jgi:homoserine dehydrogenase
MLRHNHAGAGKVLIVQLGLGGVGQALARQYLDLVELEPKQHEWLDYLGIADRSGLLLVDRDGGWSNEQLDMALDAKREGKSLADLAEDFGEDAIFTPASSGGLPSLEAVWGRKSEKHAQVVVVDVTAERNAYETLLDARSHDAHIVMCNKWTLAESIDRIEVFLMAGKGKLRYETTVGASLPVISTLDNLLATHDRVVMIEAAISGTLGYVTTEIERGVPFSVALAEAHRLGYTEPDPRDDLAGVDARRKALILARKLGHRINMADVQVESLVPEGLEEVSLEEFWIRLPGVDATYRERVEQAAAQNNVLRFLARIDQDGASVALVEAPKASLAGSLAGTESLFVYHTLRYGDQPLAIRGRGAGADITASGVLSDILSLEGLSNHTPGTGE